MFSKEKIMNMMSGGKTTEEIAAEFASALNEAEAETKRIDEEARAKADAEALLAERKKQKIDDMRYIIEAVFDYLHEWYPEHDELISLAVDDIDDDEEIEELVVVLDSYIALIASMAKLKEAINKPSMTTANTSIKFANEPVTLSGETISFTQESLDKVFEEFFNHNGI